MVRQGLNIKSKFEYPTQNSQLCISFKRCIREAESMKDSLFILQKKIPVQSTTTAIKNKKVQYYFLNI